MKISLAWPNAKTDKKQIKNVLSIKRTKQYEVSEFYEEVWEVNQLNPMYDEREWSTYVELHIQEKC
jgi:hypothetical protein